MKNVSIMLTLVSTAAQCLPLSMLITQRHITSNISSVFNSKSVCTRFHCSTRNMMNKVFIVLCSMVMGYLAAPSNIGAELK
uniref:Secreted protein n=1 Tax=Romanomermis culicivorax TaxID=13658 RepID=A0A915KM84_ROMCU